MPGYSAKPESFKKSGTLQGLVNVLLKTKTEKPADIRKYYAIFLELGLLITLIIFIMAVKIESTRDNFEEYGDVEDPEVIRGIGGGADEEAIRAV